MGQIYVLNVKDFTVVIMKSGLNMVVGLWFCYL